MNSKTAKALKKIKAQPTDLVRMQIKFARCVSALRELTDATEALCKEFVAAEKYERLRKSKIVNPKS